MAAELAGRGLRVAVAAGLALALLASSAAGPAGAAKRRQLEPRTFSSGHVNTPIPDATADQPGILYSPIRVPKRFDPLEAKDVNVSLRVTHSDVGELRAGLISPDGAGITLINSTIGTTWGSGSQDCGGKFLTIDDQTPYQLATFLPPGPLLLGPPYAGRSQTQAESLRMATGSPMAGKWRLAILDASITGTGALHCWRLRVLPRRPR